MEQQYGLSPRGGKYAPRSKPNEFQTPDLGRHVKAISSSHEDLTRLDRYQPIIIQNFELLTPSQLKFRRRSLSTANLYLSQASLTRSGQEVRPSTVGNGNILPNVPLYMDHRGRIMGTDDVQLKNDIHPSSSSSSSSVSSKQRGPDKPKRVTFSASNTTYPYNPEHQTRLLNSTSEAAKCRNSDFIYPSNYEVSRQFQSFPYPDVSDNNNNNNRNNYINNDNILTHDMVLKSDLNMQAYNGHWVPQESLSTRKDAVDGGKLLLPQRSALKKKPASHCDEVKKDNSGQTDNGPKSHINDITQQSNCHLSDHSRPAKVADCVQDNGYPSTMESNVNRDCCHAKGEVGEGIDTNHVNSDISINYNGYKTDNNTRNNILNIDSSTAEKGNLNNRMDYVHVYSEGVENVNANDNEDNSSESKTAHQEFDAGRLNYELSSNANVVNNNDQHITITNGNNSSQVFNKNDSINNLATSFIDVFSTYDVPDNEYVSHNVGNKEQSENSNMISQQIQTSDNNIESVNKSAQTAKDSKSGAKDNSDPSDSATVSSNPKVIRLKFLADSETTQDNKVKTTAIKLDDHYNELSTDRQAPNSNSNNEPSMPSSRRQTPLTRQTKSASTRQLKTKSTIEAVDLSTLAMTPIEPPKSQGDMNAQFLMSMYSVSGDRKTEQDRDLEENATLDLEMSQSRPPSRKPTDRRVSFSADEYSDHVQFRDPLSASSRGRQKERQLLSSAQKRPRSQAPSSTPLLKHRSSSAHAMMVTGNRMVGKERVVAAEKFLLKTGRSQTFDRTALNRQLEQLIVSRSLSSRVRQTMQRSRTTLQ